VLPARGILDRMVAGREPFDDIALVVLGQRPAPWIHSM